MILDLVKVREDPGVGELTIKRNGRAVGEIKMQRLPAPGNWKIRFCDKEITVGETTRGTTEMVAAYSIETAGTSSGFCYQVHTGSLFNKYDIYELRYRQNLQTKSRYGIFTKETQEFRDKENAL